MYNLHLYTMDKVVVVVRLLPHHSRKVGGPHEVRGIVSKWFVKSQVGTTWVLMQLPLPSFQNGWMSTVACWVDKDHEQNTNTYVRVQWAGTTWVQTNALCWLSYISSWYPSTSTGLSHVCREHTAKIHIQTKISTLSGIQMYYSWASLRMLAHKTC